MARNSTISGNVMGNLVWTAITYAATILIVLIIFRLVRQDQAANAENATQQLWRARQADRVGKDPAMPRFAAPRKSWP